MTSAGIERQLQVTYPGSPGWDDARRAWNLAVDQRPEAVVVAGSVDDVVAAVALARDRGWRVAAQGTGHGALAMGPLEGTLLLKTEGMRGVTIDPSARIARVEAGTLWLDVVEAAARHGLAALAGSSPDVGVVGYTIGGGLSWLGRKHGLAASSVTAVELVTADGRAVRADAGHEPDLFWACRGGGGSFGVVTALELRLHPLADVYAGILWWPFERAGEALHAWRELAASGLPDELTTVGRLLQLPPLPEVPEPVRGKSFAVVQAIHAGDPAEADRLLAPLRALAPAMDTVRTMTLPELSHLHMDPEHPVPGVGDGMLLTDLPADAVDELVRVAGPGAGSPLLSVEVRQLGGELGRQNPSGGALASLEAGYALYAVGIAMTPELAAASEAHATAVRRALTPWEARHVYLNLAETRRAPASLWSGQAYERLRRIKEAVDPDGLFRANHPVLPEQV